MLSTTHDPKARRTFKYSRRISALTAENIPTSSFRRRFRNSQNSVVTTKGKNLTIKEVFDMEIIAILTTVFMQDGPFLTLR